MQCAWFMCTQLCYIDFYLPFVETLSCANFEEASWHGTSCLKEKAMQQATEGELWLTVSWNKSPQSNIYRELNAANRYQRLKVDPSPVEPQMKLRP